MGKWWKTRQTDQWKRRENPVINPYNIVNLSLTNEQRQYNGVLSTNGARTTGHIHVKKKGNQTQNLTNLKN